MSSPLRATRVCAAVAALLATAPCALAQEPARVYVRGSIGYEASREARLVDRGCDAAPLLNFFGCQPGADGRQIGARGDFGGTSSVEVAAGVRVLRFLPVEFSFSHRPGFEFSGNATFLGAGDRQPVTADVTETAVLVRVLADLGLWLPLGRVEPFAGVGVGVSRNRIGTVAYEFPGLASSPATTTTGGGVRWAGAWDVGAGAAVRLTDRTLVEGGYRYDAFGRLETDDGAIDVVRGQQRRTIGMVAGTHAPLRAHGVYVGLRREF